jgi:hypothetical protein
VEAQRVGVDLGKKGTKMSDFVKVPAGEPIPLSVLALDLDIPVGGWDHYLAECNVEIITDDLGRRSVRRADAARLLREQAAARQRAREIAEATEQAAIERDRQFRAALPKGTPWHDIPADVLPVVHMTAAAQAEQPKRRTLLEDAFAGGETTMYVLPPTPVDED